MRVRALRTMRLGFDEVFVSGNVYEVRREIRSVDGERRRVLTALNEVGKSHVIADSWLGYGDMFFDQNFEFCMVDKDFKIS